MDRLSTFFEAILEDPENFLWDRSITRLQYFMKGYGYGISIGRLEAPFFHGFSQWLNQRYKLDPIELNTGHNYAEILLYLTGSETRAFDRAKELWYEYKAEMQKSFDDKS